MHWSSVDEFLTMGGYGTYVWGSLLACVILLAAEVVWLTLKNRQALLRLDEMEDEDE